MKMRIDSAEVESSEQLRSALAGVHQQIMRATEEGRFDDVQRLEERWAELSERQRQAWLVQEAVTEEIFPDVFSLQRRIAEKLGGHRSNVETREETAHARQAETPMRSGHRWNPRCVEKKGWGHLQLDLGDHPVGRSTSKKYQFLKLLVHEEFGAARSIGFVVQEVSPRNRNDPMPRQVKLVRSWVKELQRLGKNRSYPLRFKEARVGFDFDSNRGQSTIRATLVRD